jgi:hypothetical protein
MCNFLGFQLLTFYLFLPQELHRNSAGQPPHSLLHF